VTAPRTRTGHVVEIDRDGARGVVGPAPVTARNLALRYGKRPVFRDVSLTLRRGRITAIIGPSGCGKTSFLRCLNRLTDLIPGSVVTGEIRVDGADALDPRLDVIAHRRNVGMIFQRPNPLPMSIARNIELPLREHGVRGRAERRGRTEAALREVGLWDEVADRLSAPAHVLSGGQQQRLCIARALALRPSVLLMDEPCSALDPIASGVVEDLIARLRATVTILVVTHNLAQARRLADDVAVFWVRDGTGALIEAGPTERVFTAPEDPEAAAYLRGQRG